MSRGGDGRPRTASPPARDPARHGDTVDMLPERDVQFPPSVHHVHRHPLGLTPPAVLATLATGALTIAIVMLVLGSLVGGILFLFVTGLASALFLAAIRREPHAQTSRVAITAADRADGLARLIAVSVRAGTRAGLALVRLWGRRRRVRFEQRRRLAPLGEAVHLGDRERALQLKVQVDQLDQKLRESERLAAETMAALRGEIERELATSQSTEQLSVVDSDSEGRR